MKLFKRNYYLRAQNKKRVQLSSVAKLIASNYSNCNAVYCTNLSSVFTKSIPSIPIQSILPLTLLSI